MNVRSREFPALTSAAQAQSSVTQCHRTQRAVQAGGNGGIDTYVGAASRAKVTETPSTPPPPTPLKGQARTTQTDTRAFSVVSTTTAESQRNDQIEYARLFALAVSELSDRFDSVARGQSIDSVFVPPAVSDPRNGKQPIRYPAGDGPFMHVLNFAAAKRAEIALRQPMQTALRYSSGFGVPRSRNSSSFRTAHHLISRGHWLEFECLGDRRATEGTEPFAQWDYTVHAVIDGRVVPLTKVCMDHKHILGGGLHHVRLDRVLPAVAPRLDALVDRLIQARGKYDTAEIQHDLAELYYLGANLCPYLRGSGAAIEMVYRALCIFHGLPLPSVARLGGEHVRVDIKAMSRDLDTFIEEFPTYWETRFDSPS